MDSLIPNIIRFVVVLLALTIHEFSHALAALLSGDKTAKDTGRLTLNPISHLDIIGTIMLMVGPIGWAKPVPINPYNFRNPKWNMFFVSIAGVGSNLLLALICGLIVRIIGIRNLNDGVQLVVFYIIFINCGLAIFNLLPLPPLDGSKVFASILPKKIAHALETINPMIPIIVLIIIIATPLRMVISIPVYLLVKLFSGIWVGV